MSLATRRAIGSEWVNNKNMETSPEEKIIEKVGSGIVKISNPEIKTWGELKGIVAEKKDELNTLSQDLDVWEAWILEERTARQKLVSDKQGELDDATDSMNRAMATLDQTSNEITP